MDRGRERVGRGGKVGYVRRDIGKRRKQLPRRIKKHEVSASNTLKQLFLSCTEAFKGPGTVPSPQDVQRLRQILGMMLLQIVLLVGQESFWDLLIYFPHVVMFWSLSEFCICLDVYAIIDMIIYGKKIYIL